MHDVLLESIEETLTGLLSSEVVNALYLHLQTAHSISRDELPYRLETLCTTLDKIFGHSHKVICKAIARKFYSKLGLPYFDNPTRTLIEYVEEAKMKLRESEGQL
ncbi:MAG TPA: hypothetical protein VED24_02515, partial [Candidatus Acidoferrum sp.]|nr:hypothetical protein [Candidatus Acidoferrum sp.]